MVTVLIFLVILLGFVFAVRSSIKRNQQGCCSPTDTVEKIQPKDTSKENYPYHYQLKAQDMHCANCYKTVENAFNQKDDMMATVNGNKKIIDIYSKEDTPLNQLKQIVAKAGYTPIEIESY